MSEKRGIDYVMSHGKKVRILKRGMKVEWKIPSVNFESETDAVITFYREVMEALRKVLRNQTKPLNGSRWESSRQSSRMKANAHGWPRESKYSVRVSGIPEGRIRPLTLNRYPQGRLRPTPGGVI